MEKCIFLGEYHYFMKNNIGEYFSAGLNDFGQLGIGDLDSRSSLTKVQGKFLENDKIKKIACGNLNSLILMDSGTVFQCGKDLFDRKMKTWKAIKQYHPTLNNQKIVNIFAGRIHFDVFIELENGKFYFYGRNKYGQLPAQRKRNGIIIRPSELDLSFLNKKEKIIDIKMETETIYILTNIGNVYFIGVNNKRHQKKFRRMEYFKNNNISIVQIESADEYSLFLSDKGEVYVNGFSILGFFNPPKLIPFKKNVIKIAMSDSLMVFLTKDQKIFGCGGGEYYKTPILRLNTDIKEIKFSDFLEVEEQKYPFIDVYCSLNTLFFINSKGEVFVAGENSYGECCTGDFEKLEKDLQKIKGITVKIPKEKSNLKTQLSSNFQKNSLTDLIVKSDN